MKTVTLMSSEKKSLMLVDGHAMVFRAYHAMERQNLTNSKGLPVGAVFAFYRMLAKLMQDRSPDYFLLIFDPPGENFRHRIFPEYKANRPETPEDFKIQMKEILEIAGSIEIPMFIPEDVEADDAIACVVNQYKDSDLSVLIVSGDKDLYGLLYQNVRMLRPKKGVTEFKEIDAGFVQEDLEIPFSKMVDFLAITGDASDNIPGVKGVGPKGAAKLLNQYETLEGVYEHIEEVKPDGIKKKLIESKDSAFLSQELVTLKADTPVSLSLETLDTHAFLKDKAASFEVFKEKELNMVYQDWQNLAGDGPLRQAEFGKNSSLIRSREEWEKLLIRVSKASMVAVDTETTSSSPMRAKLLGVALAWKEKKNNKEETDEYHCAYIPCVFDEAGMFDEPPEDLFAQHERHPDYQDILPGKEVVKWMLDFLADEKIEKVGQNIKYDWLVLGRHEAPLKKVGFDTMLLSFLLKPNQRRHNLDDMALDHLGHTTIKYKDLVGTGKKQKPLISVSLEKLAEYSCEDAEVTLRLKDILWPLVEKEKFVSIYQKIDLPLVYCLMKMEENGVALDTKYLSELEKRYKAELSKIEEKIFELAQERFNVQSTMELRRVLFEKLGIVSEKKTEKGQLSTEHRVLERLRHEHPIIERLLEFRLLSKLLSTYVLPLPQTVLEETGRVHTSFSQVTAATGRLASTEPNLQNIPIKGEEGRAIRRVFIASEGCELLSLDYSQIELRILAHYSEDENLLRAYSEDQDIHDQAVYLLFHEIFDEKAKKWISIRFASTGPQTQAARTIQRVRLLMM